MLPALPKFKVERLNDNIEVETFQPLISIRYKVLQDVASNAALHSKNEEEEEEEEEDIIEQEYRGTVDARWKHGGMHRTM